jgi:hypothetical protein
MSLPRWFCLGLVVPIALGAGAARAQGRVEVNQVRALAGGVTAGDTPGFPVTISEPGSYVLTGNLQPTGLARGIDVTVNDVTIDLAGFEIVGPVVCTYSQGTSCVGDAGQGVAAIAKDNVTVRNGTIRGMHSAVQVTGASARVETIRATSNLFQAIFLGHNATVVGCSAYQNGSDGISLSSGGSVLNSAARYNAGSGIIVGNGSTVQSSTAAFNQIGISAVSGSMLIGNTAYSNASYGFSLTNMVTYTNSTLNSNNGNITGQPNPEVFGGVELGTGTNFCGTDKICP